MRPLAAAVLAAVGLCLGSCGADPMLGSAPPTSTPRRTVPPVAVTFADALVTTSTTVAPAVAPAPAEPPPARCVVGVAPSGLDDFYAKGCVVEGIAVVGSAQVTDAAIALAAEGVVEMTAAAPELRVELARQRFRVTVIAETEHATDIPEYADLPALYPDYPWDGARAYGALPGRPVAVAPEENFLCLASDAYQGQNVFVHEFGHTVLDMVVAVREPGFRGRVEAAYTAAMNAGRFADTYAAKNAHEYWAEGVQDYFDASSETNEPDGSGDGYDSFVDTRVELASYDPFLFELVAEVFGPVEWSPACPT